jgi:hypothetical protein
MTLVPSGSVEVCENAGDHRRAIRAGITSHRNVGSLILQNNNGPLFRPIKPVSASMKNIIGRQAVVPARVRRIAQSRNPRGAVKSDVSDVAHLERIPPSGITAASSPPRRRATQ